VACTEDEGVGLRDDRFDEDVELAAADEAVVVGGVLTEIEIEVAGLFGFDDFSSSVPNFSLNTATADGADETAIFPDEDFGAFVAGDRAIDFDDRGQGALLTELAETNNF